MALKINNLKLPAVHTDSDLKAAAARRLRVGEESIEDIKKLKASLDARKKNDICMHYSVSVTLDNERRILQNTKIKDVEPYKKKKYSFSAAGTKQPDGRIIIIGCGPAGLFCAYELAKAGYEPLVLERGGSVDERVKKVEEFWESGKLDINTNVQFGEGGAGTFSDGKLNTAVKDDTGRITHILETFVRFGAPEDILYKNKPHIGTDKLRAVVKSMRSEIEALGGQVRFNTKLAGIKFDSKGKLDSILTDKEEQIKCAALVLAIGHSARDTFYMLKESGLVLEPKPFAVGVRAEHPQMMISKAQYADMADNLPAADYKLTYKCGDGRGVYSFCMCPGGFVVNASSEEKMLVVNGMSNNARDEEYANSAIVVTVTPEDYGADEKQPLAGIEFQRKLEAAAFREGEGKIPVQLYTDFVSDKETTDLCGHEPNTKGAYKTANLRRVLPDFICNDIIEAMPKFGREIKGFDSQAALLLGVESRTSSPVRITRDGDYVSVSHDLIYPCGEGAGYAGGITSAALDGIRVFEAIASRFARKDKSE